MIMPNRQLKTKISQYILLLFLFLNIYASFSQSQESTPPQILLAQPLLICETQFKDLNTEVSISKERLLLKIQTLEKKTFQCSAAIHWKNLKNAKIPFYIAESDYIEKCQPRLPKPLDRSIRNKISYQFNYLNQKSDLTWVRYEQPLPCKIKFNDLKQLEH